MSDNTDNSKGQTQPIVDLDFLRGLISAVDDSGIDSLDISRGGTRIRIAKTPPPAPVAAAATTQAPAPVATVTQESAAAAPSPAPAAPAAAPAPAKNNWVEVKSPMVGTYYRSPAPEAPPYVEVGTHVIRGQTLCILEAMKLMNEMESEVAGTVREVCVENAEPVEYGQVLFRIEPDA
jgi:acetyl-CoA carboxylase biotin carboxyl carrier protein